MRFKTVVNAFARRSQIAIQPARRDSSVWEQEHDAAAFFHNRRVNTQVSETWRKAENALITP